MDDGVKRKRRSDRFTDPSGLGSLGTHEATPRVEPDRNEFIEPNNQTSSHVGCVAEELEELLLRETITKDEYRKLQTSNGLANSDSACGTKHEQNRYSSSSGVEHHLSLTPYPYNDKGIPVNWTEIKSCDGSSSSDIYQLVTLGPRDEEYDIINKEMEKSGIEVTKIERLENIYLLNRFKSETEDIKRHRPTEFCTNITYLYHGTKVDKTRICEEGLDQRLSRMGFFGKGIYFSNNPLKCIHYAKDHTVEESYILKCRVILGDSKHFPAGEYETSLQREPEKPGVTSGWRFYDSVVGCPKDYNEYVVYENRRAMIEYIITFKLDQKGDMAIRTRVPSPVQYNGLRGNTGPAGLVQNSGNEDLHGDKLQEIREAIRRKRCTEKGEVYIPPDQEKLRRDRDTWMRLQHLHKGPHTSDMSEKSQSSNREKAAVLSSPLTSTDTDVVDPVDEVMDSLVTDFLAVTNTDNVETAKYYIERTEMQVDRAITLYFEEML